MKIEIIQSPFSVHNNTLYNFLHLYLVDDYIYNAYSYPYTTKKLYQLKISEIDNPFWILHNDQEYIKYTGSDIEYIFYFIPTKGDNVIKVTSLDKKQLYCSINIETNNKDIFLGLTAEQLKNIWNRLYQIQANTYYKDNVIQDLDDNYLNPEWKFTKAVGTLLGVNRYSQFTNEQYYNFLHNVFDMNFYGSTTTALYLLKNALTDWIKKIDIIPFEEYYPHTNLYNKIFLTKNNISYFLVGNNKKLKTTTNIKLSNAQKFSINFWINKQTANPIFSIYDSTNELKCYGDGSDIYLDLNGNISNTINYDGNPHLITFTKDADSLKCYLDGVLETDSTYVDSTGYKGEECNFILGTDKDEINFFNGTIGEFQFLDNYTMSETEILDLYTYGILDNCENIFENSITRLHFKWIYDYIDANYSADNIIILQNDFINNDLIDNIIYPTRKNMNSGMDDNLLIYPTYLFYDRMWKKIDYYNQPNASQNKFIYIDGEENYSDTLKIKDTDDNDNYITEYIATQRFDATDFLKDTSTGLYTGYPDNMFIILDRPNIDGTAIIIDSTNNNRQLNIASYYDNESPYNIVNLMMMEDEQSNVDYIDIQYKTFKNNLILGKCVYDSSTYTIEKSGHLNVDDINLGNKDNQYGSIIIIIRTDNVIDNELKSIIEYLIDNIIPAHIKWYIKYDFDSWRSWNQTDLQFKDFADSTSIFYKTKYKDFI